MIKTHISYKRAFGFFFLAWLIMDILGTVSYLVISLILNGSLPDMADAANISSDPVWRASNIVLPFINLPVWFWTAWLYFKKPKTNQPVREARWLGIFWLIIVLPLDFLHYVAIPTPLTIGVHAFYIGQFPWIYIVYGIVLFAPWMAVRAKR